MKVYMTCYRNGSIEILARAEVPDSHAYGEWRTELKSCEGIGQYTYQELRTHGSGEIDIDFSARSEPLRQAA